MPTLPPGYSPLPFCEFLTENNEGVLSLLHYHTMTNCTWTVEASSHHTIRLDLRYALRLTKMDVIVIYDGPTIESKVLYRFYQLSPDLHSFQHEAIVTSGSYLTLQLSALGPLEAGDGEGFIAVYSGKLCVQSTWKSLLTFSTLLARVSWIYTAAWTPVVFGALWQWLHMCRIVLFENLDVINAILVCFKL